MKNDNNTDKLKFIDIDENYYVGNVLSIEANRIRIIMKENTNMFVNYYNGKEYRGVSINEYIGIIRGPYKIVARVEKETLEDNLKDDKNQTYSINRFRRIIEVKLIGYFIDGDFNFGIKYLPLIFNDVVLLKDEEITKIYKVYIKPNENTSNTEYISIGKTIQEELKIHFDVGNLFNTHIGIFGNTGSGKSNTLAKLYAELFKHEKLKRVLEVSKFLVLDFNGEYVGDNSFGVGKDNKQIIKLNTKDQNGGDRICISDKYFWNTEILSVLFSATEKTQKPFIQRMLDYYIERYKKEKGILNLMDIATDALKKAFETLLEKNNNKELLSNLIECVKLFVSGNECINFLYGFKWHGVGKSFYLNSGGQDNYIDKWDETLKAEFKSKFKTNLENDKANNSITIYDYLEIYIRSQLIHDLGNDYIQFDHINPLLSRISAVKIMLNKVIEVGNTNKNGLIDSLTIISFKKCNQEIKRILPLLICKECYDDHIEHSKEDNIKSTFHLIIDEAHNILSEHTSREAESFKDYRLDVFEKIIKEGRKFGFFLQYLVKDLMIFLIQ